MSRYINQAGTLAVIGRGEGLKVVITNVTTGQPIQAGALASEEQTEAEYMEMHGFTVIEPGFAVAASDYKVQLNVDGRIASINAKEKHWSVGLAEAMEELVRAEDAHTKATARLTTATAALKRAQTNAENSILGT